MKGNSMTGRTILEEIRRVRHAVSAEIGHDPRQIVQYYAALQQSLNQRLVNLGCESKSSRAEESPGASEAAAPTITHSSVP